MPGGKYCLLLSLLLNKQVKTHSKQHFEVWANWASASIHLALNKWPFFCHFFFFFLLQKLHFYEHILDKTHTQTEKNISVENVTKIYCRHSVVAGLARVLYIISLTENRFLTEIRTIVHLGKYWKWPQEKYLLTKTVEVDSVNSPGEFTVWSQ